MLLSSLCLPIYFSPGPKVLSTSMPSAVHINGTERNLIHSGVQKENSVDKIFEDVFDSDANRCSKAYLSRVCTYLQSAPMDEIVAWLAGKARTGNKSGHYLDDNKLSHVVEELSTSRPKRSHSMIADDVTEIVGDGIITRQEVSRFLKRHKISSHKISFVSALIDEDERAETLELARPYETSCLHNFDETSTAYTKFIKKDARCHKGEIHSQPEWNLIGPDGRVYSVSSQIILQKGGVVGELFYGTLIMNALSYFYRKTCLVC